MNTLNTLNAWNASAYNLNAMESTCEYRMFPIQAIHREQR